MSNQFILFLNRKRLWLIFGQAS